MAKRTPVAVKAYTRKPPQPKHPGDDGAWNLDSGMRPLPSPEQRARHQLSPVSDEQFAAMRAEDEFLASVTGKPDVKRFTDRRPHPDRNRLTP